MRMVQRGLNRLLSKSKKWMETQKLDQGPQIRYNIVHVFKIQTEIQYGETGVLLSSTQWR